MGAHWPSDLALTLVMVAGAFGLLEALVDRVDERRRRSSGPPAG
jgi:hypothetical protein